MINIKDKIRNSKKWCVLSFLLGILFLTFGASVYIPAAYMREPNAQPEVSTQWPPWH